MAYEISGEVKEKKEPMVFPSGFSKQELIIETEDGKYPQTVSLEFLKDSIAKLDNVNEGDFVCVTFDVRGREHNDRVYNSLVGWKIDVQKQADTSGSTNIDDFKKELESPKDPLNDGSEFDQDVPF